MNTLKNRLPTDARRWLTVTVFATAMAWVEAAVVFYLRTMIDRIEPYQPNPLPQFTGFAKAELVRIYGAANQPREAASELDRLKRIASQRPVPPYVLAVAHMGAGEKDKSAGLLVEAYEARYWGMVHLKVDPRWDPLRNHTLFQDLLLKLGLNN